jgi:hypothetical protein
MSFLLRKISLSKWQKNVGKEKNRHSADAITGCTRTHNNTLSIWHSNTKDFSSESVKELIVGLATIMPRPDTIDLMWLDENDLKDKGLDIISTPAQTKLEEVNIRHRDISSLDYEKLGFVSEHIVQQLQNEDNIKRIRKNDLIMLVYEWIQKENTFSINDLSHYWEEPLMNISKSLR